ncbi:MAG: hypothetical protein ABII01_02265 [Candidatus Woesearchaeota archaeon]
MDKKGFMMLGTRKIVSIVMGIILLILSIIPILNSIGVISWSIPKIPEFILWTIAMVGSIVLIIDGYHEFQSFGTFAKSIMVLSFVVAFVIFLYGLNSFGIFLFLPPLTELIINIILVIAGNLLIIGGFIGF